MSQEALSTVIHDTYVKFLNTADYYLDDEEDEFYIPFDNEDEEELSPQTELLLLEALDVLLSECDNDVELAVEKWEAWFKRLVVAIAKTIKATGYVVDAQPLNASEHNEYNAMLVNIKTHIANLGFENARQETDISLLEIFEGLSAFSADFSQILREAIAQRAQERVSTAPKLSKPRPRP